MNGREKSDPAIVAVKSTNEAERSGSEPMEPRAGTEGKAIPQSAFRTQGRADASQARERIRQAARRNKKEKFTALLHHVTVGGPGRGVPCDSQGRRRRDRRRDMAGIRGGPRA